MKLAEFKKMWTEDGTKLVEQDRREHDGRDWILFAVYFPQSAEGYGRHMAMILKVNKSTNEIEKHDLKNITGEIRGNFRQEIDDWFDRHVGQY